MAAYYLLPIAVCTVRVCRNPRQLTKDVHDLLRRGLCPNIMERKKYITFLEEKKQENCPEQLTLGTNMCRLYITGVNRKQVDDVLSNRTYE